MTGAAAKAFDLRGRTAVVTGGAGLLGAHHVRALAESGAVVVVCDIDKDGASNVAATLQDDLSTDNVSALQLDVTDSRSIKAAHDDLRSRDIRVDILVNNAAIDSKVDAHGLAEGSRVETFSIARWDQELSVGLRGAFLCSQAFGSEMATNGGGVILNIASDLSVIAPDQRLYREAGLTPDEQPVKPVTYSVIKSALVGLARYLAAYWALDGVRVNARSPGGVQTDQSDEFVQRLSNLIPMGRMAREGEYEAAIQFPCSDASSYMTGQNIVIDGGRTTI